jgi:hypothetical protein
MLYPVFLPSQPSYVRQRYLGHLAGPLPKGNPTMFTPNLGPPSFHGYSFWQ